MKRKWKESASLYEQKMRISDEIFFNLLFSAFDNAKEKGKIWINSHYDSLRSDHCRFCSWGNGYALDDRQLCLQINGGIGRGEIDIPFLMAKKKNGA